MTISRITRHAVLEGRDQNIDWFHPKHTVIPATRVEGAPTVVCTLCVITASDVFSPPYEISTTDLGETWTRPVWHVEALGRRRLKENLFEGICDFAPGYHKATGKVLGIGHTVRYTNRSGDLGLKNERLTQGGAERYGVYSVRDAESGGWRQWRIIEPPADRPGMANVCTPGCSQRVDLPDGGILQPFRWKGFDEPYTRAGSMLLQFDGEQLSVDQVGNELSMEVGRGFAEPSMTRLGDRYYLTIRAEDFRMWHAESDDGLHWTGLAPWQWDDGADIATDQTQQHWVTRHDALYLVYTRQTESNTHVPRNRAPLLIARVDTDTTRLIRETEQVLLPEKGAMMGNFWVENVTPSETWVMVGECVPGSYYGDTLLAKVIWDEPNEVVAG